jgi:mRNA interferase RelE/StbE
VPYRVDYSEAAKEHLRGLTARERSLVLAKVSEQLVHQPTVPTRNRKLMRENPMATWELRIGDLRVYYNVKEEPELTVAIQTIGVKVRSQVRIGNELRQL